MNEYAYMPDTKPFLGDTVCVTQKSFYIMKIKFEKTIHRTLLPMQEMEEMQVNSLDQEDLLGSEMAGDSSILAWKILWTKEPGRL